MSVLNVTERGNEKPHRLRRDGIVPIGLIDRGVPTLKLQASAQDVRTAIATAEGVGLLEIQMDGEKGRRKVMVKHVDKLPHSPLILSLTLATVHKGDETTVEVPVHATGTAGEVASGAGVLVHVTPTVKLRGPIDRLPAQLEVDVSGVTVGHSIHVSDLTLPEGIESVTPGEATLFAVHHVQNDRAGEAPLDDAPEAGQEPAL